MSKVRIFLNVAKYCVSEFNFYNLKGRQMRTVRGGLGRDVHGCYVTEISDNLAGDKRRIVLIISVLKQTIAARSYEKTYNLAGIRMSCIYHNLLTINALHLMNVSKSSARLSDI